MLDKTGTVTTGHMTLSNVVPAAGEDSERLLLLAGAREDASEHPIARAIATAATTPQRSRRPTWDWSWALAQARTSPHR